MAQQQILQQASTAMLSQANQKNSIALNLLG
jgi:flagellin-like hook-associated protein FlgL